MSGRDSSLAGASGEAGPSPMAGTPPIPAAGASGLRRAILVELRRSGAVSPDHLAAVIGASRTGILQQLHALEAAGLVTRRTVRHGVGRPRHVYDVTPDAQQLFPANYDALAAGLIAAIEAVGGGDLVDDVFRARRRQLAERIQARLVERSGEDAPLLDRVRTLAAFQDEQGYLADVDLSDGTIRLREHNCAIHDVATGQPAACVAELELFRDVLGADVIRERHIASGDRCCMYRIVEARARG